jgi:hypothetical protein
MGRETLTRVSRLQLVVRIASPEKPVNARSYPGHIPQAVTHTGIIVSATANLDSMLQGSNQQK